MKGDLIIFLARACKFFFFSIVSQSAEDKIIYICINFQDFRGMPVEAQYINMLMSWDQAL